MHGFTRLKICKKSQNRKTGGHGRPLLFAVLVFAVLLIRGWRIDTKTYLANSQFLKEF